ncbi:UxaA family hydrolase [Polaromonas naphthalenivorans]|uniref:Altronate dehydratase n=1 Tax=Polaromonas naphthalenivorans (strain CJ2) TaxID=365044 RepID=A1VNZ9_POLNA|nr:altronate dehydratase family protein [Polaromonas naphthalenivorans]ABM37377.1 Altronate dehydratase [Polaromonas naphthalenivorans CJ2]
MNSSLPVPPAIQLSADDNVAVARHAIEAGAQITLAGASLTVREAIASGHKVALQAIAAGAIVRKYGQPIGVATADIAVGEHVHVHNVGMVSSAGDLAAGAALLAPPAPDDSLRFQGFVRQDGRVATRNYLGVISSVNCSATVCRHIADAFRGDALAGFPNVDGVVAITHGSGCGMGGNGEGLELLQRTLRGYANHPNFAGVLVIGLGCEVNQIAPLVQTLQARAPGMFATLTIQDEGGTRETIAQGKLLLQDMLQTANLAQREPVPLSHLVVGLQCGGSDGYSGISANPALGAAVDLLVRHGGTAILSETPEIYGAEHLLTHRAVSPAVADKLMHRLQWWEAYAALHGGDLNNNPSPGNKAGGITTILEKSLGAVAKAGSSRLMDVLEYAEPVHAQGLVFMDTPGYDPVSATGQVAGGANLICFTTGRGSTYGCKPTPSLKLATNTPMFQRMQLDMDFDCGAIVDGQASIAETGEALFRLMLETASGAATRSEQNGLGDNEFLPWQLGAVM